MRVNRTTFLGFSSSFALAGIDIIAETTQTKRALVKTTVQNFLDEIISELAKGKRLEFRDFGVFEPRDCTPRTAQNPKTLEQIHVPAKRTVKFKAGRLSTAVTQKLLEHSSPDLTNKVYTNVDPVLRHAVDQIPVDDWL